MHISLILCHRCGARRCLRLFQELLPQLLCPVASLASPAGVQTLTHGGAAVAGARPSSAAGAATAATGAAAAATAAPASQLPRALASLLGLPPPPSSVLPALHTPANPSGPSPALNLAQLLSSDSPLKEGHAVAGSGGGAEGAALGSHLLHTQLSRLCALRPLLQLMLPLAAGFQTVTGGK